MVQDLISVCCARFGTMGEFCGEGERGGQPLLPSNK